MIGIREHGVGNSGGSNVKSIQRGVIKSFPASKTLDINIGAVNVDISTIEIKYYTDNVAFTAAISAVLLNPTTIRLSKFNDSQITDHFSLEWVVTEYNNVKSKQTGIYTLDSAWTEKFVTISAVNPSKAKLISSNISGNNHYAYGNFSTAARIVDSTRIGFYGLHTGTNIVDWQVIEFK